MSVGDRGNRMVLERERELERLQAVIDFAARGEGGGAVIEGPPGIGKTSLLAAARMRAADAGMRSLSARGGELEQVFSFGVVLQLLDTVVRGANESEREAIFTGAASLVRGLFEPASLARESAADPDAATLYGLYWLLAGIAEQSPLLITVDDLQWADRPSLRLLAFVARRLEGLRVAVIVAARPHARTEHRPLIAELSADLGLVLHPRPLSRAASGELMRCEFGRVDATLLDACMKATGGNPFYLRALIDELGQRGGSPTGATVERLSPRTVSLALLRRLSGLSPTAVSVAQAVAILGDDVEGAEAAALMGLEADETSRAVSALVAADLLAAGERLSYVHPIARAAVYEGMERRERERLHACAAERRWRIGASPEQVAAQAMHAAPASVRAAADVFEVAASRALDRGAPDTAATYLRRALSEPADDARRAGLAAALGRASARAGLAEADADLRRALKLAPDADAGAGVALDRARLLAVTGRSVEAIELLAGSARSSPRMLSRLRAELLAIGDLDLSVRSLAMLRAKELPTEGTEPADPTVAAMLVAHDATNAVMRCVPATEAAELARRALAGGALLRAGVGGVQLAFLAAYFLMCADQFSEAEGFFDQVIEAARKTGSAAGFASASAWRSFSAYRRGELAQAEAQARAGLTTARDLGLRVVEVTALMNLCWTLVDRDEARAAARDLESMLALTDALGPFLGAVVLDGRGRVRLALRLEAGRRITQSGLDNPACFAWRSGAAPALAAINRHSEALALADEEVQLARRWGAPRALGVALRTAGSLTTGPEALELRREAVDVLQGSQALLERARSLIELGAAMRRQGRRADARAFLRDGLDLAQHCGAPRDAAHARAELRAAGGRARGPMRTGVDALTPSEERIAGLAAAGRSNPEIAQDLFLTIKTVEMHLSSAYRKLDISSRAELGAVLSRAVDVVRT
jgi:DNA-binding CsgD family transcriptional regulator